MQVELRLSPLEPLNGRGSPSSPLGDVPTDELDGEVVHVSRSLSDRDAPARGARARRRRRLPRRAEGRGDRRRRRGRLAQGGRGRPRRERGRLGRGGDLDEALERARRRRGGRMTSHPRHAEPLPLGGDDVPYSKGLMARALIAVGLTPVRAHELARRVDDDLKARGETVADLDRIEELAGERPDHAPAAPVPRAPRARPARRRPARRRDRDGQVDGRDRARVPARDHPRDVDRLHPADDARVLLRGLHALDPLLELRGRRTPCASRRSPTTRCIAGFLEQTRNVLVGVHAAIDRALEEGWSMVLEGVHLVPGLIQVPPTDGRRRPVRARRSRTPTSTRMHFYVRDAASDGVRPVDALPRPLRRDPPHPGGARPPRPPRGRSGARELEHRARGHAGARARARGRSRAWNAFRDGRRARRPCLCESYARVTERAALAGARWLGRADREGAEDATFSAMRGALDELPIVGSDRDRRARGGRPPAASAPSWARAGRTSTSRSTRSRVAASSRAAAPGRCR